MSHIFFFIFEIFQPIIPIFLFGQEKWNRSQNPLFYSINRLISFFFLLLVKKNKSKNSIQPQNDSIFQTKVDKSQIFIFFSLISLENRLKKNHPHISNRTTYHVWWNACHLNFISNQCVFFLFFHFNSLFWYNRGFHKKWKFNRKVMMD